VIKENEYLFILGSNIRKFRNDKEMTQLILSIESGVPLSQVSAIELGKLNTTINTIKKIADALDVKVNDLVTF
jgi:transcriptional regulator with XRE-family HTH domain